jgi:hypothetical protein
MRKSTFKGGFSKVYGLPLYFPGNKDDIPGPPQAISEDVQILSHSEYISIAGNVCYDRVAHKLEQGMLYLEEGRSNVFFTPFLDSFNQTFPDLTSEVGFFSAPREVLRSLIDNFTTSVDLSVIKSDEQGALEKAGPSSIIHPFKKQKKTIDDYYVKPKINIKAINMESWELAASNVCARFVQGTLDPVSLREVAQSSPKDTSLGYPFICIGKLIGDIIPGVANWVVCFDVVSSYLATGYIPFFPAYLAIRSTPKGDNLNNSNRAVWVMSKCVVWIELMFQRPFLSEMLKQECYSEFVSRRKVCKVAAKMFKISKRHGFQIMSIDWEGYDKTIDAFLADTAFRVFKTPFRSQWHNLINQICYIFKRCDIFCPCKEVRVGRNWAVPSGSGLTSIIDCIVNELIKEYIRIEEMVKQAHTCGIVNGDDMALILGHVTSAIYAAYAANFGLILNLEKSTMSESYFTFCQRYYLADWVDLAGLPIAIRLIGRSMTGFLGFENFPKGFTSIDYSVRLIAQLSELDGHPCFNELVGLMVKMDFVHALGVGSRFGPADFVRKGNLQDVIFRSSSNWDAERAVKKFSNLDKLAVIIELERLHAIAIVDRRLGRF